MANALFRPLTPEMEEVEEEPCVEVRMEGGGLMATPFFSQDNGTTLIRGGTVVNHDKAEVADVLVQDGKIVAVGQDLELPQVCPSARYNHHLDPQGATVVDASDKFVMPGGIDSSTHLYRGEDGQKLELADDWESGSKAAVAGIVLSLVLFFKAKQETDPSK